MKEFFNNRNLLVLIDGLCKRYGKLPHELLFETTIYEFCFDVAILIVGDIEEGKLSSGLNKEVDWHSYGIERTIIDKRGEKK